MKKIGLKEILASGYQPKDVPKPRNMIDVFDFDGGGVEEFKSLKNILSCHEYKGTINESFTIFLGDSHSNLSLKRIDDFITLSLSSNSGNLQCVLGLKGKKLFTLDTLYIKDLESRNISQSLQEEFKKNHCAISLNASITTGYNDENLEPEQNEWFVEDLENKYHYSIFRETEDSLDVYEDKFSFLDWDELKKIYSIRMHFRQLPLFCGQITIKLFWEKMNEWVSRLPGISKEFFYSI